MHRDYSIASERTEVPALIAVNSQVLAPSLDPSKAPVAGRIR